MNNINFMRILSVIFLASVLISGCKFLHKPEQTQDNDEFQQKIAFHMQQAGEYQKNGLLSLASDEYQKILTLDPQNQNAKEQYENLQKIISKSDPQYGTKPVQKPADANNKPEKKDGDIIHVVKPGETLSDIAMHYYGTYLTEIFYATENKKLKVSDVLEKVNRTDSKKLVVGQEIRLPYIDDLPFLTDISQSVSIAPQPEKDRKKIPSDSTVRETEKKTVIPKGIYTAIRHYHSAAFDKAKKLFETFNKEDVSVKNRQISLLYLALIESAYGNSAQMNHHLNKIISSEPSFNLNDLKKFAPIISGDLTPDIEKRLNDLTGKNK